MRANRRALLLDALGTIIALQAPAPALCRELAERFAVEVTHEQAQRALADEIAYYRGHLEQGRDAGSLAALRAGCAEVLRAALPANRRLARVSTPALTDALLASLAFAPFPDTRQALLLARERGERVIVVSNWDISLHRVLERLELAPLLHAIVTAADVGAGKPAAAIFTAALELAGTSAEQATHVGDSLEEDIAGARAAGLEAVLLRRRGGPGPNGVTTIASLAELT